MLICGIMRGRAVALAILYLMFLDRRGKGGILMKRSQLHMTKTGCFFLLLACFDIYAFISICIGRGWAFRTLVKLSEPFIQFPNVITKSLSA